MVLSVYSIQLDCLWIISRRCFSFTLQTSDNIYCQPSNHTHEFWVLCDVNFRFYVIFMLEVLNPQTVSEVVVCLSVGPRSWMHWYLVTSSPYWPPAWPAPSWRRESRATATCCRSAGASSRPTLKTRAPESAPVDRPVFVNNISPLSSSYHTAAKSALEFTLLLHLVRCLRSITFCVSVFSTRNHTGISLETHANHHHSNCESNNTWIWAGCSHLYHGGNESIVKISAAQQNQVWPKNTGAGWMLSFSETKTHLLVLIVCTSCSHSEFANSHSLTSQLPDRAAFHKSVGVGDQMTSSK